jgi:hypothetical protein
MITRAKLIARIFSDLSTRDGDKNLGIVIRRWHKTGCETWKTGRPGVEPAEREENLGKGGERKAEGGRKMEGHAKAEGGRGRRNERTQGREGGGRRGEEGDGCLVQKGEGGGRKGELWEFGRKMPGRRGGVRVYSVRMYSIRGRASSAGGGVRKKVVGGWWVVGSGRKYGVRSTGVRSTEH